MSRLTAELREAVIAVARDAAAAILEVYECAFEVEHKAEPVRSPRPTWRRTGSSSPGWRADPGDGRCCRRKPPICPGKYAALDAYWLVDPLDGTREFVKRNGEFTVNIALIDHGVSVFGVVLAPVGGAVWHGCRRAAPIGVKAKPRAAAHPHAGHQSAAGGRQPLPSQCADRSPAGAVG